MILDTLDRSRLYQPLHKGFVAAFEFLRRPDLAELPNGKHPIVEDLVFAVIGRDEGRDGASPLEAHRKYIDVQCVLAGDELMGWSPTGGLVPSCDFDPNKDIGFFADSPGVWFPVLPGQFAIFFPSDAHAPLAGKGPIHKAVVKVAVEYHP